MQLEHDIRRATDDLPECLGFHFGFALYPIDDLRAKDDFEILSTQVDASAIRQLFQVCLIGQEFAGSPGSTACNPRRDQDDLAGGLVSEAGGYCIIFENIARPCMGADLPRTGLGVQSVLNPVNRIRGASWLAGCATWEETSALHRASGIRELKPIKVKPE